MEFPGKCLTNIQKIVSGGMSTLSQTSSEANDGSPISHPPTPPSGLLSVRHSTLYLQTELQRIETALRSESILTATKVSNLEVWIFGNGHQLGAVGETLASAEKEVEYLGNERNLKLHKIRSVSLMSSSLPKRDTSVALGIIGSIPSVSPSTLESNFRASQTGNIKAAQMTAPLMVHTPDASMNQSAETAYNPQGQEDDVVDSYGILMSAVIAAITFKLVKSFGYIPLNFRTLVAPRSTVGAEDSDNQDNDNIGVRTRSPVVIETLDARLTTAGTLVVCHSSALQPALLQVDWKGPERGATPLEPGTTDVWLAPGGTIARYLGQSQVLDKELRNDNVITHDQREEQGHSFTDERDQRWMLDVRAWLKGWGLVSQDFENRASWVNVQIRMPAHIDPSRPQTSDDHDYLHTMLWPARLCFYKEKARIDKGQSSESSNVIGASPLPDPSAATKQLRPSTSWSSSLMDGGTHDPLAFAEEWFLGERSREDSRRVRKDTIEQLARSTHPPTTNNLIDNPSGLTNLSRNMNYTDVQAANTIYPTPPDGVQSQGGTGPSFPDVPGATPVDVIEQSGPNESIAEEDPSALPEMDFMGSLSNEDNDDGSAPRKHSDLADFGLGSGNIVASVDDDMFEELDEAMFGGHAVTDADFSFFDEPDLDMGGDGLTENVESTEASHNQEPNPDLTGGLENMLGLDFDNTDGGSKNRDFLESFDASVKLETAHGDQMTGLFDEELGEAIEGPNDLANTKPLRSSQAPESQDTHTAGPSNGSILSPPLSPVEVMKKLIPGLGLRKETAKSDQNGGRSLKSEDDDHSFTFKRRQSYFNPIAFNNTLDTSDHKYKADGRFWMRSHDRQQDSEICLWKIASSNALRIPKIGFPKRQRRVRIGVIEDKIGSDCDMQENRMNRSLSEEGAKSDIDGSESDSNSETEQSDQDDISEVTEVESFRSFPLGTKRKRNQSDEGEDRMSTSFERLAVDVDPDPGLLDESFLSLWETLAPNAADWSLAGYFSLPDDESVGVMRLDGKELISVAQIVADQTISATLQPYFGGTENIQEDVVKDVGRGTFAEAVKETFSKAIQCDLITFLTVEDIPPDPPILGKAPLRQGIRRGIAGTNASGVTNITSAELFKIHSPHVRVRRADTAMEVLPSALPFWETFGFGPCSGKKDVVAYCVYLPGQGTRDAADGFLERLGSVYESCRLGSHVRGESAAWSDEGLLPVKTPEAVPKDSSERMHDVKETCILLGKDNPGDRFIWDG
ncbi:MAG: mediator of RNA polymerase II transcription subunit 13 [Pycnora praestabilis]|nr:MAG: mediator of RNA polymerase II transcription subunit 13 [Pycnora praestabilis]